MTHSFVKFSTPWFHVIVCSTRVHCFYIVANKVYILVSASNNLSALITGRCGHLTASNTWAVLVRMRGTEFLWVLFFVLIV